jgi:hypothetical protein
MELVGDEKRIQALFRELKLEDECSAPRFSAVWNHAPATAIQPPRTFRLSFAIAAVLLAGTVFSLALWSRRWQQTQPANGVATLSPIPKAAPASTAVSPEPNHVGSVAPLHRVSSKSRTLKLAARRQAELLARNALVRDAVVISSWQSPTTTLLRSPADEMLTSLPPLDENANELKSFLPNTPK